MRYLALLFVFWASMAYAQLFLPGTEDIPQMEGLKKVEETASFDNPSERMVLIGAETIATKEEILKFYKQTLINLGWREVSFDTFERGTDTFSIEIIPLVDKNQIQFRLSQSNS